MSNQSFETDDKEIIKTIQDAVKVEVLDIKPDQYVSRPVEFAPQKPHTHTLNCSSLTALVDYINKQIDQAARESVVLHVVSPTQVNVVCQIEKAEDRRFAPLSVTADVPTINLIGHFLAQEDAMIELQAKFVQEGAIADVLRNIGNVVMDEELTQQDDGITQQVMVSSGIERKFAEIVNPIALKPFRTFAEIEQPASPFVLRLKKTGSLTIALFEADGGKWRNAARQSIKAFLDENIHPAAGEPKIPVIA